jgi:hypothetical protein
MKVCFAHFGVSWGEPALHNKKAWFFLYPAPLEQSKLNRFITAIPFDDHSEPQHVFVV